MSQYFQIGERVLWNPSTGVAQLFLRAAESLATLTGISSGLGPMREDECEIDIEVFSTFTDAVIRRYVRSNHVVLRSLMEGFTATAIVLVDRSGRTLPSLQSAEDPSITRLIELSQRHAQAMVA